MNNNTFTNVAQKANPLNNKHNNESDKIEQLVLLEPNNCQKFQEQLFKKYTQLKSMKQNHELNKKNPQQAPILLPQNTENPKSPTKIP